MDLSERIYPFPYHFSNIWSVSAVKTPDHIPNDDDGGPVVINSINSSAKFLIKTRAITETLWDSTSSTQIISGSGVLRRIYKSTSLF